MAQRYEPAVPLDQLHEHPDNPRRGDVERIARSIDAHGFYGAVLAQDGSGRIIAGNHRYRAARSRGAESVPVLWLEVDDDQARRILLADNSTSDHAVYDDAVLAALLGDLKVTELGLEGTGWSDDELAALLGTPEPGLTDPDHIPDPPPEPRTKPGDLWLLGGHRLLCGDATNPEHVARLMDGEQATLMATDPPYLVDYDGGHHPQSKTNANTLKDKNWDEYVEGDNTLYRGFIAAALTVLADRAPIYQWHASARVHFLTDAWEANGLLNHAQIIWVKARSVLTRSHFMWQHEPCIYGWRQGHQPERDRRPPPDAKTIWHVDQQGATHDTSPAAAGKNTQGRCRCWKPLATRTTSRRTHSSGWQGHRPTR